MKQNECIQGRQTKWAAAPPGILKAKLPVHVAACALRGKSTDAGMGVAEAGRRRGNATRKPRPRPRTQGKALVSWLAVLLNAGTAGPPD